MLKLSAQCQGSKASRKMALAQARDGTPGRGQGDRRALVCAGGGSRPLPFQTRGGGEGNSGTPATKVCFSNTAWVDTSKFSGGDPVQGFFKGWTPGRGDRVCGPSPPKWRTVGVQKQKKNDVSPSRASLFAARRAIRPLASSLRKSTSGPCRGEVQALSTEGVRVVGNSGGPMSSCLSDPHPMVD